jgi:nucleotide-binding universal stress UspA family protein
MTEMTSFQHVLIAIDFSRTTEPLIKCADELRALGTSRLTLVHVLEVGYPSAPAVTHEDAYRERLETYAQRLREGRFEVFSEIRSGAPGYEIAQAAADSNVDMILLAAHDHSALGRTVMGSVAADVLRHASVPVLLDRYEEDGEVSADECELRCGMKFKRVLLATDGSDSAIPAEEVAAALASQTDKTIILTVIEKDEGEAEHRLVLKSAHERVGEDAVTRVARGQKASAEIERVAEEEDATIIIVGKHGRGYLADRFLGSTAENVSHRARRPVLVVPQRQGRPAVDARSAGVDVRR